MIKAYIDMAELTVRIMEAMTGTVRPPKSSAEECLNEVRRKSPSTALAYVEAAYAAAKYCSECAGADTKEVLFGRENEHCI